MNHNQTWSDSLKKQFEWGKKIRDLPKHLTRIMLWNYTPQTWRITIGSSQDSSTGKNIGRSHEAKKVPCERRITMERIQQLLDGIFPHQEEFQWLFFSMECKSRFAKKRTVNYLGYWLYHQLPENLQWQSWTSKHNRSKTAFKMNNI